MRRALGVAATLLALATVAEAQEPAPQRDSLERKAISGDITLVGFDDGTKPWREASFSASARNRRGSIIGRVNYANRFATDGVQFEVDAYPRIAPGKYFYVNAGYSGSSIYPEFRYGLEYNQSLPDAFEMSAGVRYLDFGGDPVVLWTGSVGKYRGNWWYSVRPFVRFKDTGASASVSLIGRRYYADSDNYWGYRVGFGNSPSENATPDAVSRTSSQVVAVYGSRSMSEKVIGNWAITYANEGLTSTHSRGGLTANVGFTFRR